MDIKIKVKKEGRQDTWIVTNNESLKQYINSLNRKIIHNFIQSTFGMLIGADYKKEEVFEVIDNSTKVAVMTDKSANLKHSLACISEKLYIFDIGEITKENLEIEK